MSDFDDAVDELRRSIPTRPDPLGRQMTEFRLTRLAAELILAGIQQSEQRRDSWVNFRLKRWAAELILAGIQQSEQRRDSWVSAAVATEREACVVVVEAHARGPLHSPGRCCGDDIAAAIRARGAL